MDRFQGQAAAWAAPLFSHLQGVEADASKRTHKLPQMPCVLWLPDYRAYVRSFDLFSATFKTCPTAEGALRLGESLAEEAGRNLVDVTGLRVHVRAFHPSH